MLEMFNAKNYFDYSKTLAAPLFDGIEYPWEVLPRLESFILALGPMLPADEFEQVSDNVWISRSAVVAPTASITGPCIVDSGAQIRHCAFIRGNVIVGKGTVVGNSCEVKNSLLFDEVEAPHFNYVGDSILGYKSHLGAGAITSNIKNDKKNVEIHFPLGSIKTEMRKLGAIVGDGVQVGCNCVLNPGTVIGKETRIYPLNSVRGWVDEKSIYKHEGKIVEMI
ncbi:MAG: UDP-N-acetylglucosamine pyrophosphorylase [Lachnospiraceae bacterium]|nr:UDP-N-acetylglucosamine pyrophosphorylase [Lachnospiraceae bacterium]MDD5854553.1 UDP-N-acetylglucosamine pyrophosphorylase [Lachnospiraceae bacterium]